MRSSRCPGAQRPANVAFSSSEPGSTFTCSLDGGPFEACTSPQTYEHLKRKKHHFEVVAIDVVGNMTRARRRFDWKVRKNRYPGREAVDDPRRERLEIAATRSL